MLILVKDDLKIITLKQVSGDFEMTIRYEAIVNTIIVQILKRDVNEEYAYPGLDMETLKQAVQTALEVGIEMGVGATLALSNLDGK